MRQFQEQVLAHVSFKGGLKNPKIIRKSVDEIVLKHNKHIMKDIDIQFIIPALDITKRKSIYYSSSPMEKFTYYDDRPISETIRSSSSIPVIFTPNRVSINNKIYYMMDGGITSNTPTLPLKQFSNFVIGLEPKYYNTQEKKKIHFLSAFTETFQSMRRSSLYFQKKEFVYNFILYNLSTIIKFHFFPSIQYRHFYKIPFLPLFYPYLCHKKFLIHIYIYVLAILHTLPLHNMYFLS